jgi:peptide/nickel transport system substrate-binding protein
MLRKTRFYWALLQALVRRNQKKISASFVFLILLVFLLKIILPNIVPKILAAYKESQKPTFIEGVVGTPAYPNPLFDSSETAKDISSLIFRGLTRTNSKGELEPDLAKDFKKISDTEYLFSLKKDVFWHDGEEFTSDDVVYTVGLTQEPSYQGPLAANFKDVEVEKVNDYQVKFKLKEPFSPFPYTTTIGIIPKHIPLKKYKPIGTGPFQVKKIDKEKIVLTNNNLNLVFKFYKNIDQVKIALNLGGIHAFGGSGPQEVESLERFGMVKPYYHSLPFREAVVFFNTKTAFLQEKNTRQALSYVVDKENLEKQIGGEKAVVAKNQLPLVNWVNNSKERYPYNLEEAKKRLDAAGFKFEAGAWQKENKKLSLTITNVYDPELNSISNFLKEAWINLGIMVETEIVSPETLRKEVIPNGNFEVLVNFQEISPDPDQYVLWHTTQVQKSNITGISKSKLDKILEDSRKSSDQKDRSEKYRLFTTLLSDEAPAIFLYYPQYTWLVSKKVTGIDFSDFAFPSDRFNSFKNWKIERKIL